MTDFGDAGDVGNVRDPDETPQALRTPSGSNGFDAPHPAGSLDPAGTGSAGGARAAEGQTPGARGLAGPGMQGAAGDRRIEGNGHRSPVTAVEGTPVAMRGRWIVPLALVSAIAGMCMFLGVVVFGGVATMAGLRDIRVLVPAGIGLLSGGVAGVWLGARIAVRLTGEDPEGRLRPTAIGGTAGLVLGLGLLILAAQVGVILVAGLGLIAPGIGAAIGDRIALARRMRISPKRS